MDRSVCEMVFWKSFVGGKCLAAIIEGDNDNEMVYAITVLTTNLFLIVL